MDTDQLEHMYTSSGCMLCGGSIEPRSAYDSCSAACEEQVAQHARPSDDGTQGIIPMLQQLQNVIKQSEEALRIAMENYREAGSNRRTHSRVGAQTVRSTRSVVLPIAAAIAFGVSACLNNESGTPEADAGAGSSTAPTSPSGGTSAPNDASPLSGLDPCSLLDTPEVEKYGPVESHAPERKTIGSADVCSWDGDAGDSASWVPTRSIAIRENGGVDQMNDKGSGVQQTEEDGRRYARSPGPGGCTIAIGVTDTSRVDIVVTSAEDSDKACEIANALTEAAEPNVPQG